MRRTTTTEDTATFRIDALSYQTVPCLLCCGVHDGVSHLAERRSQEGKTFPKEPRDVAMINSPHSEIGNHLLEHVRG